MNPVTGEAGPPVGRLRKLGLLWVVLSESRNKGRGLGEPSVECWACVQEARVQLSAQNIKELSVINQAWSLWELASCPGRRRRWVRVLLICAYIHVALALGVEPRALHTLSMCLTAE